MCRSLTGAWIETYSLKYDMEDFDVAPSRERGLKLEDTVMLVKVDVSLPHGSVD